ncbi:unnamed protein product [Symbiodinium natans]|uniref:Uncharacterized protein n=1 Tax=Symbiodinium natans TaxID=878477 RepID=A0A812IGN0_9DINO|nr:unnamed protein product [Symbiodinium natans]
MPEHPAFGQTENVLGEFHKRFDPKNMLLLRFKDPSNLAILADFAEDTEGTVRRVFKFLGLQEDVPLPDLKTIRPEDVMEIELEKESRTKKLSAEDQELLERHFEALLGLGSQGSLGNLKPYTLNPTPYTLHPTPYTLNPKP